MSQLDIEAINDDIDEDSQKNRYLTFRLGSESYGIEIRHVTEIIVMQEITRVPDLPESMIGVINLRGHVITVMDMRKRFRLDARPYDDRTCIIVVDIQGLSIGLVVDTVSEVLYLPEEQVDPPPRTHSGVRIGYILGMGKVDTQVKVLLDIEKILHEDEVKRLDKAS